VPVIFLSGDDDAAKAAVVELFTAAGFFAIDLGDLVTGGRNPSERTSDDLGSSEPLCRV
jgi:predicted dinucleotide-binding enzyme